MKASARILTIAGSDPSGGAGLQADIKTITMLGGYAMAAVTAITVQDTCGVSRVEVLAPDLVAAQVRACIEDIGVDAVKIGMLGSAAVAEAVADALADVRVPIVFDPVMVATSGGVLADGATVAAMDRLMGMATLVTPNLPELEALSGRHGIAQAHAMGYAAEAVLERTGARALLAKGGHWPTDGDAPILDCLYMLEDDRWREWEFHHPRLDTRHTHGTGCTLASAVACGLGQGLPLHAAVARGIDFVQAALRAAPGFGAGAGPLGHHAVRGME